MGLVNNSGTFYDITYDNYNKKQSKSGKDVPSKEDITNSDRAGQQKKEEQAREQQKQADNLKQKNQEAVDKAKSGDYATIHEDRTGNDFFLIQLDDGEWVLVQRYATSNGYLVLHWNPNKGAFYGDDGIALRSIPLNDEVMRRLRLEAEYRGLDYPEDIDILGEEEHGEREAEAEEEEDHTMTKNVVLVIREAIALWFYIFRAISVAIMLIILLVLGIKIAFSSIASQKAAYKKMLVDWFIGLLIIFLIQYIMVTVVFINQAGIDMIKDTASRVYTEDKRLYVAEDASEYGSKEYKEKTNQDIEISLYESVRTRAYDAKLTNGFVGMVLYACLVYFAYKFTFVYLKRILNIAILTIMAPIVGLSFALNKILTGKATIFQKWLREYITVVLIQFFHALAYVTFLMGTLKIALTSVSGVIFSLVLLKYLSDSESIIRKIFGIDSSAVQDLAGTMKKSPTDYASSLAKGAGIIVGAGAAGQANKELRNAVFGGIGTLATKAYGAGILYQAKKAIDNKDDISDENLNNAPNDRDFISEALDYKDDDPNLNPLQSEFRDIVESERYLDAMERGEEYEGDVPKYKSRYALNLAKQKLANNPTIIMASMKQRIHDALDYRTYTERYVETLKDGSFVVSARFKGDEENITKKRHEVYKELIKKKLSMKNIIGYSDEDMKQAQAGFAQIGSTVGGFLTSVVSLGAVSDANVLGLAGFIGGQMAFKKGLDTLSTDNYMEFLPADFEDNPALSIEQLENIKDELTGELITLKDKYIVNSITRQHRNLARKLSSPIELGLMVTTLGGRHYRNVSNLRWQYLKYDVMGQKQGLERRRLVLLKQRDNIIRTEQENAEAKVSMQGELASMHTRPMTEEAKKRRIKSINYQMKQIDKEIEKLDKKLEKIDKREEKILNQIGKVDQANQASEDFIEKAGYVKKSGGIGYSQREYVVDTTLKALKVVDKEIRKQKQAYWKAIEAQSKQALKEKENDPLNIFIKKGFAQGILNEVKSVTYREDENSAQTKMKVENIIVPVYDLKDCILASAERFDKTDKETRDANKDALDEAYEEWKNNYEEVKQRKKQQTTVDSDEKDVELPYYQSDSSVIYSYKVSLDDVKQALIRAAAKKNKTVRVFDLTSGNTNIVKDELLRIIARIYGINGNIPYDVIDYVNSLDSVITYAKSCLVASEAAAVAISSQIEQNGKNNINVDQVMESVKSTLKEYFEDVDNALLPDGLKKHGYIKENTILEATGYDTIEGLAQKAINKKFEAIATIISSQKSENEGVLSPEVEETINKLREMAQNANNQSSSENSKRKAFRMFATDKKIDEDEDDEDDDTGLGFDPDDITGYDDDAKLSELLKSVSPGERQEILDAIVAREQAAEEEEQIDRLQAQLDGAKHKEPSQQQQSAEIGDDTFGDELEDALNRAGNDQDEVSDPIEKKVDRIINSLFGDPEGKIDVGGTSEGTVSQPVNDTSEQSTPNSNPLDQYGEQAYFRNKQDPTTTTPVSDTGEGASSEDGGNGQNTRKKKKQPASNYPPNSEKPGSYKQNPDGSLQKTDADGSIEYTGGDGNPAIVEDDGNTTVVEGDGNPTVVEGDGNPGVLVEDVPDDSNDNT